MFSVINVERHLLDLDQQVIYVPYVILVNWRDNGRLHFLT